MELITMETITINQTNPKIDQLIDQTIENNQPILLKGAKGNAVLISEQDWNAMQETLYLQSISGMVESIQQGGETPIEECIDESTIRSILNG
jgi:antitoxin YefM